ncbi:hypothetical protein [Mitsuaria sp. TWR114]|uniref:hypothetical protein n=1 Tax=Mitsuaria sp. TWR114 TaxID=2601731 RepID=UPI00164BC215|nr:hypothetical protein [Mitsuaria sp. TWR114]
MSRRFGRNRRRRAREERLRLIDQLHEVGPGKFRDVDRTGYSEDWGEAEGHR